MIRSDTKMLGASGYDRAPRDLYQTEPPLTQALCEWLLDRYMLTDRSTIWEPACGGGMMVDVLKRYFGAVIPSDIVPLCPGATMANFLEVEDAPPGTAAIVTNPPFGKELNFFIARALGHLRQPGPVKLVAFIARSEVNHAVTRRVFFGDCPEYMGKLLLTWRPRWKEWEPGDEGPRHNYSVYLWGRVGCYTGIGRPFEGFLYRPTTQGTMPASKEAA